MSKHAALIELLGLNEIHGISALSMYDACQLEQKLEAFVEREAKMLVASKQEHVVPSLAMNETQVIPVVSASRETAPSLNDSCQLCGCTMRKSHIVWDFETKANVAICGHCYNREDIWDCVIESKHNV